VSYGRATARTHATIACWAAIDLDNLILGRADAVPYVREFAESVRAEFAFGAMLRALAASGARPVPTVSDVEAEVEAVTRTLIRVAETPALARGSLDLHRLRTFCLEYSRQVSAGGRPSFRTARRTAVTEQESP
jgi:hypothetical protein